MYKHYVNSVKIWAESPRFIEEVLVNNEYGFLYDYDVVVDAGANVGAFSLWIYPHAKTIYAIEPNPKPMRLLEKTIEDNGFDKIVPIEYALAAKGGIGYLKDTDDKHKQYGSASLSEKGLKVNKITIPELFNKYEVEYVDLLKIDIEGAEQEVLESEGFAEYANKIGTIIGEYHDGAIEARIGRALTHSGFMYKAFGGKFIAKRK